jgi:hypothetical protein
MIKKLLFMFLAVHVFAVHAETITITLNSDEIYKEIYDGDQSQSYSTPGIVNNAVQEAIWCLQQLQERLLHQLIQQWVEGLIGYLKNVKKSKITIQVVVDGPDGVKQTICSESI